MAWIVHELALELVQSLTPLMPAIARHDANLARQLRRSASSIVLNVAEGEYSDPGTKRARFFSAAGSALRVATGWRYIDERQARESLGLLDRVLAILWRLTH